jgi:D-alanyl-D-alanine carboxypeptidase
VRVVTALITVVGAFTVLAAPAVASDSLLESRLGQLVGIGIPGAQVDDDGKEAARGVADLETGRRMRPELSFRVGSITKSFTATVALQLVAERKLSLDDTVERWLPGLLPYGGEVTVRNLLQHSSGIPDYWEAGPDPLNISFVNDPAVREQTYAPQELVARVAGDTADFAPGASVQYSNTNYVVVGLIIEAATGNELEREINRRLIRPLDLDDTRFRTTIERPLHPFTRGYSLLFDADGLPADGTLVDVTEYNATALWAMGNIVSTTEDLRTFYGALLRGAAAARSPHGAHEGDAAERGAGLARGHRHGARHLVLGPALRRARLRSRGRAARLQRVGLQHGRRAPHDRHAAQPLLHELGPVGRHSHAHLLLALVRPLNG